MKNGKVVLLGAGPGDLELLTLKAVHVLAAADLILLDDLANPDILSLAPQARAIHVGKRGGCKSTPQDFIQRLMRRYALQGKTVARVKGGEVLLFGRAGEELAYLRAAGVQVEIINGISSGLAAAASLGMSLTHREHCQGVTFVTAHTQDHGEPDWAHWPRLATHWSFIWAWRVLPAWQMVCWAHWRPAPPPRSCNGPARQKNAGSPPRCKTWRLMRLLPGWAALRLFWWVRRWLRHGPLCQRKPKLRE